MKKVLITGGSGFIGTNLIDLLFENNYQILNFDKTEPIKKTHISFWLQGNLLQIDLITNAIKNYNPDIIIHLAARTDTLSDNLEDYLDNTLGTENLIKAIKTCNFDKQLIITSTQYVYKSNSIPLPLHDTDFKHHTTYGKSKVITEELTRNANLACTWTIVRPANIWGPWHMRYPIELWKIIDKGFYIHPSTKPVIRTYGYVKNIVSQIKSIIEAPQTLVNKQTFYLGDAPIDSFIWLNTISQQLKQKSLKRIPSWVFKFPALVGDIAIKLRIPSPLYSVRFNNMIEDYPAPTQKTIDLFGVSHPNLEDNVMETIQWIKTEGVDFFEYWKNKNN